MKKLVILLIIIFAGCKKSGTDTKIDNKITKIEDRDIYEIVNLILEKKDSAVIHIDGLKKSPWQYVIDKDSSPIFNSMDSLTIMKNDSIFSKADLKFIDKQIQDRKDFKFQDGFIKSKKIISSKTIVYKKINNHWEFWRSTSNSPH